MYNCGEMKKEKKLVKKSRSGRPFIFANAMSTTMSVRGITITKNSHFAKINHSTKRIAPWTAKIADCLTVSGPISFASRLINWGT